MKTFTFGEEAIEFGTEIEFYAPYVNKFVEMSCSFGQRFHNKLTSCKTTEELLKYAPHWAQEEIDQAILRGIDILLNNGIIEYDCERIKSYEEGKFNFLNCSEYKDLLQQYKVIVNAENEYNKQKEYERSNRSRYQAYGFGVGDQIKARVKAGAMNMVTDTFRSIGDSTTDGSDRKDFDKLKNELSSEQNQMALILVVMDYIDEIGSIIRELLQKHTGQDESKALFKERIKANAIFENLKRLDSIEQQKFYLRQIIMMNPFQWEYMEYILENYTDLEIPFCDVKEMAVFLNEYLTRRWEQNKFFNEYEEIKRLIPSQENYECLKRSGIEKDYIDDGYNLLPQKYDFTEGMPKAVVLKLAYIEIEINYVSLKDAMTKLKACSPYELDVFYNSIKDICDKHHILDDNPSELSISTEIGSATEEEYQQIKNLLQKLKKNYTKACLVDEIKFVSLETANHYRQDLELFGRVYSPGKSYADYESRMLRSVLEELQKTNFNTEEIQRKIMSLEKRVQELEAHEDSSAYQRGKNLLENFTIIMAKGLYMYGSEEFLHYAYKVKTSTVVNKVETDPYPLIVYDTATGDGIKGFAITDKYFYDFNSFLGFGAKSIELERIAFFKVNINLEIFTSENKCYRIKLSDELNMELFAKAMAASLYLSEDKVQIVPEDERNSSIFSGQLNDVKEKLLSGAKISGLGKIFKKSQNDYAPNPEAITDNETADQFCSNCGLPVNPNAKFCSNCGKKLI